MRIFPLRIPVETAEGQALPIEGNIRIELGTDGDAVSRVSIVSTRPVLASRVFHGKSMAEVLKTLPLLFAVCGTAQAVAGVRACEQALGIDPPSELEQYRDELVSMETIREHLGRIFLDWPVLLAEAPAVASQSRVMALARQFREGIRGGADPLVPFAPGGQKARTRSTDPVAAMQTLLEDAVFDMPAARWLELDTVDALSGWATNKATVACRLVADVMRRGWMDAGRCAVPGLPELEPGSLVARVDDDFVKFPQWQGECRETSCLTRSDSPLLRDLEVLYGNGLGVRITARLTEIARLSVALSQPDRQPLATDFRPTTPLGQGGTGIGQVSAARGQLVHCVTLDHGMVVDYRILAPTEWNFHPRGVVTGGLGALRGDRDAIEGQARLLISSIDPCVSFELGIV